MPRASTAGKRNANRKSASISTSLNDVASTSNARVNPVDSPTSAHYFSTHSPANLVSLDPLLTLSASKISDDPNSAVATTTTTTTIAAALRNGEKFLTGPSCSATPTPPTTGRYSSASSVSRSQSTSRHASQVLPANGHATSTSPSQAAPTMNRTNTQPFSAVGGSSRRPMDGRDAPSQIPGSGGVPHATMSAAARRNSVDGVSEISSSDSFTYIESSSSPRMIDVNASKNDNVHLDSGIPDSESISTILGSFPLVDTVAILLILSHIPSMWLSLIYLFFTCVAIIPPVKTLSGMTVNIAEVLESSLNKPSITNLCLDGIILVIWLFLWLPIQDFVLDITKVVISVTLGAGAAGGSTSSSKSYFGTPNSQGFFVGVLLFSAKHVLQGTKRVWAPSLLRAYPASMPLPDFLNPLHDKALPQARSPATWAQILLSIHILIQGLITAIKRWYLRREQEPPGGSATSLVANTRDPEAGNRPYADNSDVNSVDPDLPPSTDGTSTTLASSTSAAARKRRRPNALVRLPQPIWSALASAKMIIVKELELWNVSKEAGKTRGNAADDLGNASFNAEESQIWISFIGCDEVCFSTSFFHYDAMTDTDSSSLSLPGTSPINNSNQSLQNNNTNTNTENDSQSDSTAGSNRSNGDLRGDLVDASKPFFVRINNAPWPSTSIIPSPNQAPISPAISDSDETLPSTNDPTAPATTRPSALRWCGSIYGLRPNSTYVVEVLDCASKKVLFTTNIATKARSEITPAKSNNARGAPVVTAAAPSAVQLRPDSPVTTLQASISEQERRLKEVRAQFKGNRKEWKSRLASLRKELDSTDNSINNSGSADERLQQKIRAQKTSESHIRQTIQELEAKFHELEANPTTLLDDKRAAEALYNSNKKLHESEQRAMRELRESKDKALKEKQDAARNLANKRNKLNARIVKIEGDLEEMRQSRNADIDEQIRRQRQHEALVTELQKRQLSMHEIIGNSESAIANLQVRVVEVQMAQQQKQQQQQHQAAMSAVNASHLGHNSYDSTGHIGGYGNMLSQGYDVHESHGNNLSHGMSSMPPSQGLTSLPPPGLSNLSGLYGASSSVNQLGSSSLVSSTWRTPYTGTSVWSTTSADTSAGFVPMSSAMTSSVTPIWGTPHSAQKARGRSSSMLSDVSGFTQSTGAGETGRATSGSSTSTDESGGHVSPAGPAA